MKIPVLQIIEAVACHVSALVTSDSIRLLSSWVEDKFSLSLPRPDPHHDQGDNRYPIRHSVSFYW